MPESLLIPSLPEAVAHAHSEAFTALAGNLLETSIKDGAESDRPPPPSLVAQCQQGQPLTSLQLATVGQRLGQVHQTPLDDRFAGLSHEPFQQAMRQLWAVFRHDGSLPPLESAGQERLRQRFLDQHAMALQVAAYELEARLHPDYEPPLDRVVSHGTLSLTTMGFAPDGQVMAAPAVSACALPPWWDVGCVLAWLPLLAHVSYSAVHYEPVVLKAYLAAAPVESPYEFVRQALPVAGLTLASLLLNDRLSWVKDIYLKEIFLKQALSWVSSPSQVDWLVQLPH